MSLSILRLERNRSIVVRPARNVGVSFTLPRVVSLVARIGLCSMGVAGRAVGDVDRLCGSGRSMGEVD